MQWAINQATQTTIQQNIKHKAHYCRSLLDLVKLNILCANTMHTVLQATCKNHTYLVHYSVQYKLHGSTFYKYHIYAVHYSAQNNLYGSSFYKPYTQFMIHKGNLDRTLQIGNESSFRQDLLMTVHPCRPLQNCFQSTS